MTCRSTAIYSFTCAHCGRPFTAYGNRHRKYCFLAHYITDDGIKTPGGKDERSSSTIKSIRSDKKHKSNALPQKRFTANCLTKKQKKNEGEIPQYYVEGNHEAITLSQKLGMVRHDMVKRGKGGEVPQRRASLLQQNPLRRMRELVRLKSLALDRQIPLNHLVV